MQNVLVNGRDRAAIRHRNQGVSGVRRTGYGRAEIAVGQRLGAVRAQFLRGLAPAIIGPLRGQPVRSRRGQGQAVHRIVGVGLGLAQRVCLAQMVPDIRIVSVARGPARNGSARRRCYAAVRGPALGDARHGAKAVPHIGLRRRKRVARLDGLAQKQSRRGIVGETRTARKVRRARRAMRHARRVQPAQHPMASVVRVRIRNGLRISVRAERGNDRLGGHKAVGVIG